MQHTRKPGIFPPSQKVALKKGGDILNGEKNSLAAITRCTGNFSALGDEIKTTTQLL